MTSSLPYRPCVGICLLNDEGKVFAGERLDNSGAWQMPQGGIDEGEDVLEAARRELLEEIGTDNVQILGTHPEQMYYDLPDDMRARISWGHIYQGQVQSWVYARFTGVDSDIDLTKHDFIEFGQWRWMTPEELTKATVGFKIPTYEKVFSGLKNL